MLEQWAARDPIETYRRVRARSGVDVDAMRDVGAEELGRETEWALAQPMPDPATATEGVFARRGRLLGDGQAPWSRVRGGAGHA